MRNFEKLIKELSNKDVAVIGAGRSGIWASILLAEHCKSILLSDIRKVTIDREELSLLKERNVKIEFGEQRTNALKADLAVISPGIPPESEIVKKLRSRGTEILGEIEIAYWFTNGARIAGITGSNGKSTTTYLTYQLIKNTGHKVFYGGNIGIPFSKIVFEAKSLDKNSIIVLELSSFQLENIKYFHPYISTILNITPDHLDRHHSFENYIRAKLNICKNQVDEDYYVYNHDDPILRERLPSNCRVIPFSLNADIPSLVHLKNGNIYSKTGRKIASTKDFPLPGKHNLYNLLASLTIALLLGFPEEHLSKRIPSLESLEHRLEFVANIKGVKFYNDSKATNVDSVKYAVDSFREPIILILGGKDKDADFLDLREHIKQTIKKSIIIGECKKKIEKIFRGHIEYELAVTMEEAVKKAFTSANSGDIVLLSPACASFDMYENFEERGKDFKKCVMKLREEYETT